MKRIAVIIRDRQSEALRMAVGLSILHKIDIFIIDGRLDVSEVVLMNLEMIKELKLKIFTNDLECLMGIKNINIDAELRSTKDIAKMILEYDNILAY